VAATWTQQRGIEHVGAIRGHNDFDFVEHVEAI
jgi:hypothetical protein